MNDVSFTGVQWAGARALAISLGLLLILGACAGVMPGVAPKMEGVRTVGIISAVGSSFDVRKIGVMVFGNDLKKFPIDSWGVDEIVVEKARAALARSYDVRRVTYPKAPFLAERGGCRGYANIIRAEASPQGLDAYIVVGTGVGRFGTTNQPLVGLGIVEMSGGMIRSNSYFVHALYTVNVIDGRSFACKSYTTAGLAGGYFMATINGPNQQVDAAMWPQSLDAASNQHLKTIVVDVIDKSLPTVLQQQQLTN